MSSFNAQNVFDHAQYTIVDLYETRDSGKAANKNVVPFHHELELRNHTNSVWAWGHFDDGAMVDAMSSAMWERVQDQLAPLEPSRRLLRMANGSIVTPVGCWTGIVRLAGAEAIATLEVFDSAGGWDLLFGKQLLKTFGVVHDYNDDTIQVNVAGYTRSLTNGHEDMAGMSPEQRAKTSGGCSAAPARGVYSEPSHDLTPVTDDVPSEPLEPDTGLTPSTRVEILTEQVEINVVSYEGEPDTGGNVEVEVEGLGQGDVFTRHSEPFKPERVDEVLRLVTVGADLTVDQARRVRALITEFADAFALSVSEVKHVKGAAHHLHIDPSAKFSTKVHQKPLTPPQKAYLHASIDDMLTAGIIERCDPANVKCVSPTTLAQKAHVGDGLTLEELQHRVNDECVKNGMDSPFILPPRPDPRTHDAPPPTDRKWRICQNFAQINRVTQVPPMPQGDIRAKQQRLSGHRWVSTFDFAAGFYACEVDEVSRPYTAFYVEGRGYFWYRRMPFGLTGAPTTFANMTAEHLHDLLAEGVMELLVDDGGTAGDDFEVELAKMRRILTRIRERDLSLSASKSRLFMTEAVFAGATIGPKGVQPDLAKLTAIVNWKTPQDALNLSAFLGLTGWFRDLIKDYARIEQPLRDLLRGVELPDKCSKTVYRRVMSNYNLTGKWNSTHTNAFLTLKAIMTSEPVLKGPKWDGTPFVITTDGSKEAFGAVLAQRFTTVLPNGRSVTKLHPVGFASKRTSRTEEKYKPFLLEFAALKFGLDKFSDTIWGFPVEVETDCQALRDHLLNDKLSATHARWRDGILSHQIIDVRHVPGRINVVADGLSRAAEGTPREEGDGSDWTVSEDWEAATGLTHDVFLLQAQAPLPPGIEKLRQRFDDIPMLLQVIDALLDIDKDASLRVRGRARHRASEYLIEDERLWKMTGGHRIRARTKVECVSRSEAIQLAKDEHLNGGHWGRDSIKKALMDRIWTPGLDSAIVEGIKDCGQCKNFGSAHINALLDPITRRHPFELIVGDYLSLPKGAGGYKTAGLYLDTYSQHVWGFKYKSAGSAKTTEDALHKISTMFVPCEVFMSDGGSHFNNTTVRDFCVSQGTKAHVVSAYSPWVNGLVEGTNKLLLHVLKRLCAPDLNEDEYNAIDWESLPTNWPNHFDHAITILNRRLLPALKFTPKELLLGLVVNTRPTPVELSTQPSTPDDALTQMAYVEQQRLDGYSEAVTHAVRRKSAFDRKVLGKGPGEVIFLPGDLVQVYRSDLDYTFKSERKLLPKWSRPYRVVAREVNSYTLETCEGVPIDGRFSARRLRRFEAKEGTRLAEQQGEIEARRREEEAVRRREARGWTTRGGGDDDVEEVAEGGHDGEDAAT